MAYTISRQNLLECTLCPHNCKIAPGDRGFCGVRENRKGTLHLPFYGAISSGGIDSVEKKPMYHFLPGTKSFSIGFWGCNMRCPFCQNYEISQNFRENSVRLSPKEVVEKALEASCPSISYTYSEPLVHFEYCLETAQLARKAGLANIIVSNGMINPPAAEELFSAMDAANIDLKSYNSGYYDKELKGTLETVKETIRIASSHCHVELTTLIVPGKNDDPQEIKNLLDFIAAVGRNIPLHISRYFPNYMSQIPATPIKTMDSITKTARRILPYVYQGNTEAAADTICPSCGNTLIQRRGYHVDILNTSESCCDRCGKELHYQVKFFPSKY